LHIAITAICGNQQTDGCQCLERVFRMNAWGTSGCREHLDEIVGWLLEKKPAGRCAAFAKLPKMVRAWAIRIMVTEAISNAENASMPAD